MKNSVSGEKKKGVEIVEITPEKIIFKTTHP
jgi:hypothetical protein